MTKSEAIKIFVARGYKVCTSNTSWASRNKTVPVYWSNAQFKLLETDWFILLYDDINCKLYLFYIPEKVIQKEELIARSDHQNRMHIEINYNDPTFTDRKSNYSFRKFLIDEIQF